MRKVHVLGLVLFLLMSGCRLSFEVGVIRGSVQPDIYRVETTCEEKCPIGVTKVTLTDNANEKPLESDENGVIVFEDDGEFVITFKEGWGYEKYQKEIVEENGLVIEIISVYVVEIPLDFDPQY